MFNKITPRRRAVLSLWLSVAKRLHLSRNVTGGIAWTLGLPPLAGGEETPEEKAARERREAEEAAAAAAAGQVTVTRAEWDNIQRQLRESTAALRKAQEDEAERKRRADEEAGNHQAIAQRAEEARRAAEEERDRIKAEREAEQRQTNVERVARQLRFKDPSDVRVPDDIAGDAAKTKQFLEGVAKEKTYLIQDGEIPKVKDVTGDGGGEGTGSGSEVEATGVDRLAKAYADAEAGRK
jgi:hypothetical protein